MATIPYKLKEITSEYSLFRDNQVLTAAQLNEIVHYFEDQQRLSRVLLTGVGIICGFRPDWRPAQGVLELGSGAGVTTDGDLVHSCESQLFSQYRPYEDDSAFYAHFNGLSGMLELFSNEAPEGVTGLSPLSGLPSPQDYVLVLYLENYGKAPDACTRLDCDNQGERQVASTRVLLVPRQGLQQVVETYDSLYQQCYRAGSTFFQLEKITVGRVRLRGGTAGSLGGLVNAYQKITRDKSTELKAEVARLFQGFRPLLDPAGQAVQAEWESRIDSLFGAGKLKEADFQYRYDLLKLLAETYEELRQLLWNLCVHCCPDPEAFPRHLMVRELVPAPDSKLPAYRHGFYPSPAVTDQQETIYEAQLLFRRMQAMLFAYQAPAAGTIKATPSRLPLVPVGERAIPYYFRPEGAGGQDPVRNVWQARSSRFFRQNELLSYWPAPDGLGGPAQKAVTDPLSHSLDQHDFFRIEGHLGMPFDQALADISRLKEDEQLPFEVIGLRLGTTADSIDINDYECYFEDLLLMMNAWREEQKCIWQGIGRFFSSLSAKKPQVHLDYPANTGGSRFEFPGNLALNAGFIRETPFNLVTNIGQVSGIKTGNITGRPLFESNPLKDSLVVQEDTLGKVFASQVEANADAGSVELVSRTVAEALKLQTGEEWSQEQRLLQTEIPASLLAMSYEVNRKMPADVASVNPDRLKELQQSFDRLCQNVKGWQATVTGRWQSPNYNRAGYEARYQQLLGLVIENCCATEKLKDVYEEIERRKKKLLQLTMLAEYARKHPGMEHMGGVPKGGTLVLVYTDSGRPRPESENEFSRVSGMVNPNLFSRMEALPVDIGSITTTAGAQTEKTREKSRKEEKKGSGRKILASGLSASAMAGLSEALQKGDLAGAQNLFDVLADLGELALSPPFRTARYQVVADFALPYLCCSDCPPVQFVVPRQKTSLLVPAQICYTPEMPPVQLTVVPEDGEVKTDKGENLVRREENGQWVFDPASLPADLLGQPVSFTVNEQETGATTVVFRSPQPVIELVEVKCFLDNGYAEAVFRNLTTEPGGVQFSYEWNFGDGTPGDTTRSRTVTHQYLKVQAGEAQRFTVTLNAANGPCTATSKPLEVEVLCDPATPPEPEPENCGETNKQRFEQIREVFAKLDPGGLAESFQQKYKQTEGILKNVESEYEAAVSGEFNDSILEELGSLIAETLRDMGRGNIREDSRKLLAALFRLQMMLLLLVFRCQKDFDEGQLIEWLQQTSERLASLEQRAIIDPEGQLAEYIEEFLKTRQASLGEVVEILQQIQALLKEG